ncbi:MAG: hypothetical protein ACO21J_04015, partial [Anaerohalosphaeraceae bacterium]
MKNLLALLCVLAVIGTASAGLVPNGDFTSAGINDGWDLWVGPEWDPVLQATVIGDAPATGGNPDGHV